jgi:imidazolonepropionase-like amidohydrolase
VRIHLKQLLTLIAACSVLISVDIAAQGTGTTAVLFENVRIFDGRSAALSGPASVLVRGSKIVRVSLSPIAVEDRAGATVINGAGRTLMPGLIDAHAHPSQDTMPLARALGADYGYIMLWSGRAATQQLMRGFTSVRDAGGSSFALKRAIDEGIVPGPRIWPSGAGISQTGGHGDFGAPTDVPRPSGGSLSYIERSNFTVIADGVDAVRQRVREQLRLGASQIKLMAGGGVASDFDPLDVSQYSEDELRAAVEAADAWNTYVTVHAYTPKAIRMAISAGVKCIEHGQLIDEPTAKLLAEKGVWLSLQPFLDDEDAIPFPEGSSNRAKQLEMVAGTDNAYALARKYKLKTAWGTDTLFDEKLAKRQGAQLAKMTRWYSPAEVLRIATSVNAELLALSGPRNPYPGKLGVVEEDALADLLLVNGDPLANIKLIEDPDNNFLVIMKDGTLVKNSVP